MDLLLISELVYFMKNVSIFVYILVIELLDNLPK